MKKRKNAAAVALGSRGGKAGTAAQRAARARNMAKATADRVRMRALAKKKL